MISSLTGVISDAAPSCLEVEVHGVGYEVHVPSGVSSAGRVGDAIRLHVHTVVREDAITLFGFSDPDQRRCFRDLIGVTGVGPRIALAVLSSFEPDALRKAVAGGDVDALTGVPGIGKRGAQRMVLELKEKMGMPSQAADATGVLAQASQALAGLGYSTNEVREVLDRVPAEPEVTVEAVIKAALKELARI